VNNLLGTSTQPKSVDTNDDDKLLTVGKADEVKRLAARRKVSFETEALDKDHVAIDIGPDGIRAEKGEFMILAILPNSDEAIDITLQINQASAIKVIHPCIGDQIIIYKCTEVRGNLGSRCIATPVATSPM
jgi:hypothetical protein